MFESEDFGSYQLTRRLAVSNMSEVFLARRRTDPPNARPVVVKRLLDDVASVEIFMRLFDNESQLSCSLSHPNTVKFLDSGEVDGRPFLVMEWLEGLDAWRLMRRLKRSGNRIPPAQSIFIVREILKALEYLHELCDENGRKLDIVHHDVSPSNILIGMNCEVKLGDFGIAYSEQHNLASLGRKFKGKVHYLSPEQVKGERVDHRSDLYSAGVVLAELLLGRRPFDGPTDLSIIINVRDRHSPALDEGLKNLPGKMAHVLDRSLATDPATRYQHAGEFRMELEETLLPGEFHEAIARLPATLQSVLRRDDAKPRAEAFNVYRAAVEFSRPIDSPGTGRSGEAPQYHPHSIGDHEDEVERRGTPATPTKPTSEYIVKRIGGTVLGMLPLSDIIEGIVCGRIQEDDLVSINGTPFSPVVTVPELAKHLPSVTPTDRAHDLGLPDLRGLIGEAPAVGVLLEVYMARETGLLLFECSGVRKDVYLEQGTPRYVSSNVSSELLGEFLVRQSYISRMELDMALAVLDKYDGHLGDTLLGLDILDSITLLRAITSQIKLRLFDIFGWEAGEWQFYRGASPTAKGFRLSVPGLELIKEGCLHGLEGEDMEAWMQANLDRTLQLEPSPPIALSQWNFSTSYSILLADLETPRKLEAIMHPYRHTSLEVRGKLLRVLRFAMIVGLASTAVLPD